jgi:hypothetical protein
MTPTIKRLRRQENAHFRRAKALGCNAERFDPVKLFDRDEWTCFCGGRINPDARGPGAPSIDHRPARKLESGQGFATNRNGPFKAKIGGGCERREP